MPEPVLISIAAALAGRAAAGLYDVVRRKFARDEKSLAALESADGQAPGSAPVRVLAERLEAAEQEDPVFGRELRAEWDATVTQHAETGGVNNQVSGIINGRVVQARDIHGDIHL
jgi:hypothetical protein